MKGLDGSFLLLSCGVLLVCLFYAYLQLSHVYPGFEMDSTTWLVTSDEEGCADAARCLRRGDELIEIGGITHEDFLADRTVALRWQVGEIPVRVKRQEEVLEFTITPGRDSLAHQLEQLINVAIMFLFWFVGTIAILFIRPRDERLLVLVLLSYDTSIWFAAGSISATQLGYSVFVFHLFVWLFLPLAVHLHLILPTALLERRRLLLGLLYTLSLAFFALDLLQLLPEKSFFFPVLLALASSLSLLVYRLLSPAPPAVTMANRLMFFGMALGLGPWIVLILVSTGLAESEPASLTSSLALRVAFLATLPIWPLAYVYAIYKHQLGALEFRANRLLGTYAFVILCLLIFSLCFYVGRRLDLVSDHSLLFSFLTSMLFVAIAAPLQRRCCTFADRVIFGIKYTPERVVSAFAERLPAAFDQETLKEMIVREIAPTLLIRQSALYLFVGGNVEPVYEQNLPPRSRDERLDPRQLLGKSGRYLHVQEGVEDPSTWVRLVVPLVLEQETIGIWLLGRRDPDDFYSRSDIELLENLANQMASVVRAQQGIAETKYLQQQLFQAQKLEAVGRLSAGIAHDFNNLLAVIHLNCNFLQNQLQRETTRKYLKGIVEAVDRARALIRELMAFSRQQVMEVQRIDLNAIVASLENILRTLVGEAIELETRLDPDLPAVEIDPAHLGQVIVNLAVNAKDSMPDGGRLVIETAREELVSDSSFYSRAEQANVPPGSYVVLKLQDTGWGMAPEIQSQVFEPFFTTKEHGKGTGLGLSIVYGIIKQSLGYIAIDSDVGKGTTFFIYLPAAEGQRESTTETESVGMPILGSETILLVEDEETLRTVIGEALETEGYTVLRARDGQEALQIWSTQRASIDLLLTDVVMPQLTGTELARRLLAECEDLLVLYMSGYYEESLVAQADEQEIELIQKPFSAEDLLRKVRRVLDSRRVHALEKASGELPLAKSIPR